MTLAFNIEFRKAGEAAAKLASDPSLIAEIAGLVARSVMDEREACAKIADEWRDDGAGTAWDRASLAPREIATAIRTRNNLTS